MVNANTTSTKCRKRLKRLAGWGLTLLVIFMLLRWFEQSQVYQPEKGLFLEARSLGLPYEEVYFESDHHRLHGWFFPGSSSLSNKQVMLLCHGNGGNVSHSLHLTQLLLQNHFSVLVFDYRGYGLSEGKPSELGTYQDGQAALEWLVAKGFPKSQIIVFGDSLGGAIASNIALNNPVGGLILKSTFTSTPDLGTELFPWLPVRWLARIKYDTRKRLPEIKAPVLILHSKSDTLIGYHHAEQNFKAANEPKMFREIGGDHNSALEHEPSRIADAIQEFMKLVNKSKYAQ